MCFPQWEGAMSLKVNLQFVIMMIPTLLLLLAAVVTLAAPV